jgi:hypothetical protein
LNPAALPASYLTAPSSLIESPRSADFFPLLGAAKTGKAKRQHGFYGKLSRPRGKLERQPMPPKFKVGDAVILSPSGLSNAVGGGGYEVIKVLPDHNGERQYRIKSANEPHERSCGKANWKLLENKIGAPSGR